MATTEIQAVACGCGRAVPEPVVARAVRERRGVRCSSCGARCAADTVAAIRSGRRICGYCGVYRCPDGCCCAC